MSRKITSICLMVFISLASIQAQDQSPPWWNSYNTPGTVLLDASMTTINFNEGDSSYLQFTGEYIFSKFFIQDSVPIDLGIAATGVSGFDFSDAGTFAGAGAGIGAHTGFRGFGGKFGAILEKFDIFAYLGAGYTFVLSRNVNEKQWSGFEDVPFVLFGRLGLSYYLSDSFAITAEDTHWGTDSSISLGVRLRLGDIPAVGKRPAQREAGTPMPVSIPAETESSGQPQPEEEKEIIREPLSDGEAEFYLDIFDQLYWGIFCHGGLQIDDYNFIEGEGAKFAVSLYNEKSDAYESITIQKALLQRNRDHSAWSYRIYLADGETLDFEVRLDTQDLLLELTVIDDNVVSTYVPDYPMEWNPGIILDQGEFSQYSVGTDQIDVPSGNFTCDEVFYDAGDFTYTWYLSRDVPGYIVSYTVKKSGQPFIQADLIEINLRNSSILGD